ncbi:hypothetical protein Q8A67_025277 [Cirrhinus molitorella]|uniref:Uncharacterized protein n=1 Tax=Cirrhinus molitorella TaxID=172907 RepID=A0AA88NXE6_9TELE|nr:hypothetical protein Q8A67_025277 [Cirrhinus molitorella]
MAQKALPAGHLSLVMEENHDNGPLLKDRWRWGATVSYGRKLFGRPLSVCHPPTLAVVVLHPHGCLLVPGPRCQLGDPDGLKLMCLTV